MPRFLLCDFPTNTFYVFRFPPFVLMHLTDLTILHLIILKIYEVKGGNCEPPQNMITPIFPLPHLQYAPKYTVLKLAHQYRILVLYILAHTVLLFWTTSQNFVLMILHSEWENKFPAPSELYVMLDFRFQHWSLWRVLFAGIRHCVVPCKSTDISEEHTAFIFMVKK
jgi:hypothetical protein